MNIQQKRKEIKKISGMYWWGGRKIKAQYLHTYPRVGW
jgi:hypothetical protein